MDHLNLFKKHVFYYNLNELMLETRIAYKKDFVDILTKLDDDLSREILNLMGKDVDTRKF